jgi:hypothetical protein
MLTQAELKVLVNYDLQTGVFTWNKSRKRAKPGVMVGTIGFNGYCQACLNYKKYYLHRLAWLYVYGEIPNSEIDHINRIKTDNRICNLRLATRNQNLWNTSLQKRNKSGHKNISLHKPTGLWRVIINKNKQIVVNKYFITIDEAVSYAEKARKEHFGVYSNTN